MDSTDQYKILKLKSGDSIICEISEYNPDRLLLYRPMMFKTVTMLDHRMNPTDILFMRNWAEYSTDQTVEIPTDIIVAEFTPDRGITNVYEMEKIKQDFPEVYEKMKRLREETQKIQPPFMPPQSPFMGEGPTGMPMQSPLPPFPGLPPGMNGPNGPIGPDGKPMKPNGAQFHLQLPLDVAKELIKFLEEQGIDIQGPEFPDDEDEEFFDDGAVLFDEELPEEPKLEFGNNLEDWSPDPNDYLK